MHAASCRQIKTWSPVCASHTGSLHSPGRKHSQRLGAVLATAGQAPCTRSHWPCLRRAYNRRAHASDCSRSRFSARAGRHQQPRQLVLARSKQDPDQSWDSEEADPAAAGARTGAGQQAEEANQRELGTMPADGGAVDSNPARRLLAAVPGPAIMLAVACLWGTNPIALRYLYRGEGPPSPAALAGVQSTAAALLLLLAAAASTRWNGPAPPGQRVTDPAEPTRGTARSQQLSPPEVPSGTVDSLGGDQDGGEGAELGALLPGRVGEGRRGDGSSRVTRRPSPETPGGDTTGLVQQQQGGPKAPGTQGRMSLNSVLNATTGSLWWAGAETGCWAFLANAATVVGFQNTAAGRGAFLIRLSAIFTPMVASLAGERVVPLVWGGCVAALAGGVLMTSSRADSGAGGALASGDLLLVAAAVMWSLQTVRLGKHVRRFPPLPLAAVQMATMAVLSDAWLIADVASAVASGAAAISVWGGCRQPLNWAVMLWPAVGPWGAGTALQVVGQGTVTASQTQILLASDPLWATLFARVLGGGEGQLGPSGWAGGALIVSGAVVAGVAGGGSRKGADDAE